MKSIVRRIDQLEQRFGTAEGCKPVRMILCRATQDEADVDRWMEILGECGYLRTTGGGIQMVKICDVPDGLDASETEKYIRENGAALCGSRRDGALR